MLSRILISSDVSTPQSPEAMKLCPKTAFSWRHTLKFLRTFQDLSVGAFCLVFDDDTITALKTREPLQLLHFLPDYGKEPDDVLVGLKRLDTSLPRQMKLDQEEPAAIGDRIDNLYVCCQFPSFSWFYQNWILPDWLYDGTPAIYADIIELAGSHSTTVCGAVVDSFEVMDVGG